MEPLFSGEYSIVEETVNDLVRGQILDGVEEYNRTYFRSKDASVEIVPFVLYAKDRQGKILGGVHGSTFCRSTGGWVDIEYAWVDENYRSYGIGTELFESCQEFGRSKDCRYIQVFTWAYQAVDFYKKLGFECVATIPKWIEDYDAVFFRKQI